MVRITDSTTREIIRDTSLELLIKNLVKEFFKFAFSFATGAFGCFLIQFGMKRLLIDFTNNNTNMNSNTTTTINKNDDNTTSNDDKRFKIIKWLMRMLMNNIKILTKLMNGGIIGVGLWIVCQPLIVEMRNLNQNVIYYVNN